MADNRMMDNRDAGKNGALITAGLVILALIVGLYLWMPRDDNPRDIEPAAGNVMERGIGTDNTAPAR